VVCPKVQREKVNAENSCGKDDVRDFLLIDWLVAQLPEIERIEADLSSIVTHHLK
jgi:hypothetical protein